KPPRRVRTREGPRPATGTRRPGGCPPFPVAAVNLAAGLRDNPQTDGQDMNIHPTELFCIQAEHNDGVYLTPRGRRIAKRHFGEPWAILEPGYQRVIAKLNSRASIPANNARRSFAGMALEIRP